MINGTGRIGSYSNGNLTADQIRAEMKFRDYTTDQKMVTVHHDVVELSNKLDVVTEQNNMVLNALVKVMNYINGNASSTREYDNVA